MERESSKTRFVDAVGAFIDTLVPSDSDWLMLREAVYYMACDPVLTEYILWPCYQRSSAIVEPFQPYFELWRHGVYVSVSELRVATVLVQRTLTT